MHPVRYRRCDHFVCTRPPSSSFRPTTHFTDLTVITSLLVKTLANINAHIKISLHNINVLYTLIYRGVKKFCITKILYGFSTSSAIISNLFLHNYNYFYFMLQGLFLALKINTFRWLTLTFTFFLVP